MPNRPRNRRRNRARPTYCYYECPECFSTWIKAIRGGNVNGNCRNCNIDVVPHRQSAELEVDPNHRCFGHYKCPECARTWMSANSWVGYGQQCQTCKIEVMAHIQTPLRPNHTGGDPNKAHPIDLCGKCRRLGHSCRKCKN